jgi:hypothetical protein
MFTTYKKSSGEVSFNPHGPVLYGPVERAVCILKRITTAHSSTLHISLLIHVRVPGSLLPSLSRLPPGEFMAGLHPAKRANIPPKGQRGSTFEDIPAQFPIEFYCYAFLQVLPLLRLKVSSVSDLHS